MFGGYTEDCAKFQSAQSTITAKNFTKASSSVSMIIIFLYIRYNYLFYNNIKTEKRSSDDQEKWRKMLMVTCFQERGKVNI